MKIDPDRLLQEGEQATGIYIRAQGADGRYDAFDIVELDKASLLTWLRSRGGDNIWAENVIGLIMGHGPLHEQ